MIHITDAAKKHLLEITTDNCKKIKLAIFTFKTGPVLM